MADENIVTNIVAKSDFSNLIADLNKVSLSLTKLQDQLLASNKMLASQVAVMNRSFADTLRSTGQFSTHFVSLSSDVDKFGSQLDRGQLKLSKFFQVYGQHAKTSGGLIRDLAKQQVQLQNAILQPLGRNAEGLMQYNVHIPRGLDLVKNKAAIARQELQIMNKVVQEGANQLINWGKNTQWAGRQLTVGLTVPLAAFGKASADAFKQADEQLVRLTKVYGGVAATSAQELGKVRADVAKTAAELSKSYGSSFTDTIALAADIAATGKTGNELLGSIKETTRLAVLGEVDRQDAMKATLAIQTAFKQNTEELSQSINFLNAVENQTSTTLNDLVEAIPKAGPIIKGLGGNVKDLALYLTAMREGGISAAEGANALKSGLASLINPTKVAQGMFAGFGINLKTIVEKNAGDVTATILDLQAALETLNPLQKQQALEQLFGKFQFARMNALFENLGKQGSQTLQVLDLMKASSQDLANIAGRELSQVTESASGKYRRAIEGLKADLAGIGEQFLKINTSLINFVDGIIKFTQHLPGPIKQVLGFMGMLTAAAGPLIMLTGVLGNFFGYIIKGAYHFKSLFRGGEGWKLLTPEILAAQKAGNLVEQTFYSDAKAAAVLKQAIAGLAAEFSVLEQKANSAAVSINPAISTVSGGTVMVGGQRVVNPNNPLAGAMGTRAAGHHIPRSQMSETERLAQTIHSFTPVPIPLNQKIGAVPQIFTEGDLPKIPGLTTSGGASTGIVAGEAAKWHALMGSLSMLTKREVADLKKEIARTGTFTTEINQSFGQLLPAMTQLTSNAAAESAAIVAELQSGKITVDAARAKIIAINTQLEKLMAQTTTQVAADLGRTANLTQVPLINQPIVGPTGKANIKELFRTKRPSAGIIDKIARALGVRTFGAGYSTETTMPKRMATGGTVGGSGNTDTVPAMLTPGEFVINKKATAANLPLLQAINGAGSSGPGFNGGANGPIRFQRGHAGAQLAPNNLDISQLARGTRSVSYVAQGIPIWMTDTMNQELRSNRPGMNGMQIWNQFATGLRSGRHPLEPLALIANQMGLSGEEQNLNKIFSEMMNDLSGPNANKQFVGGTKDSFENYFNNKYVPKLSPELNKIWHSYGTAYGARGTRSKVGLGTVHIDPKTGAMTGIQGRNNPLTRGIPTGVLGSFSGSGFSGSKSRQASSINLIRAVLSSIRNPLAGSGYHTYQKVNRGGIIGMNDGGIVMPQTIPVPPQNGKYNMGGMVQGYVGGGMVGQMIGSMAGWTGGSMLGQQVAGSTGSMIGGMAGSMALPVLMAKLGSSTNTATGSLSKFASVSRFLGPWGIGAAVAVTGLGLALKNYNDKLQASEKLNRLAFAGGVKPLEDFGSKLKEVQKSIEDTRAVSALLHDQLTGAGISGLVLTAKQFSDLRDQVVKAYPELVKLFKEATPEKLGTIATGLKAQFVAAGKTSKEANASIAALMTEAGKGGFIQSMISNKDVQKIIDTKSAIKSMIDLLDEAQKSGGNKGFAEALLQSFTSIDETILNSKDRLSALKDSFDAINSSQNKNVKLTQDQINEIKKIDPEFAKILNTGRSIGDAISIWRIKLSGVQKDLSGLNSNELQALAEYSTKISDYFDKIKDVSSKMAQDNPVTGGLAKEIDKFNKSNNKAQQAVVQNIQDQIDLKTKLIDKIKKEGEARKKALQDQQSVEDTKLQIQKEQLAYQDALASGDMSAAAQAQLNIQRLVGQQQLKTAEDAIDKSTQAKIDALQAQIDVLSKAGTAAQNATPAKPKTSPYQASYDQLNQLLKDVALSGMKPNEEQLVRFNDLIKSLGMIPGGQKLVKDIYSGATTSTLVREDRATTTSAISGTTVGNSLSNALTSLANKDAVAAGISKSNDLLQQIFDVLSGNKTATSGKIDINNNRIPTEVLRKNNINLTEGGKFTAADGKQYQIVRNTVTGFTDVVPYVPKGGGRAMGGYIKKYDIGGSVFGPGTSTSDSIPAYLSNGEYVLRASAVRAMGVPMLDQINKMAAGGLAARYDVGNKMIMPSNTMGFAGGGMTQHYNVGGLTINTQPGQNEMEIARMAINIMNVQNSRNNTKVGRVISI